MRVEPTPTSLLPPSPTQHSHLSGYGARLPTVREGNQSTTGIPPDDRRQATEGGPATPGIGIPANSSHPPNPQAITQSQCPLQEDTNNTNQPEPNDPIHPHQKRSRANIHIASLNTKGRSHTTTNDRNQISKWNKIHRTLRQEQLSVLCLQETHLEQQHIEVIQRLYGKRITLFNSANRENPGTSAGVAFVINNERLQPENTSATEIIPGRAIALEIKWPNGTNLTILNIYAPNAPQQHPPFWTEIRNRLNELQIRSIDILLGDFNITEDLLDRSPARYNDYAAVEALCAFRESIDTHDSWRHDHPNERCFTFISNTQSMSRLDRIYTSCNRAQQLSNWKIKDSIIPSDHRMISVRIAPPTLPFIGPGRWTMPLALLTDNNLMDQIATLGKTLLDDITSHNYHNTKPQIK